MRKSFLIALVASILLAAVPALAQVEDPLENLEGPPWVYIGTLTGTSTGSTSYNGKLMRPMQFWKGDLKQSTEIENRYCIIGWWNDEYGNSGQFQNVYNLGSDGWLRPAWEGRWFIYIEPLLYLGGVFKSELHYETEEWPLHGSWITHWPPYDVGDVKGFRVW